MGDGKPTVIIPAATNTHHHYRRVISPFSFIVPRILFPYTVERNKVIQGVVMCKAGALLHVGRGLLCSSNTHVVWPVYNIPFFLCDLL